MDGTEESSERPTRVGGTTNCLPQQIFLRASLFINRVVVAFYFFYSCKDISYLKPAALSYIALPTVIRLQAKLIL